MRSPELEYQRQYVRYLEGNRVRKPSIPSHLRHDYDLYTIKILQERAVRNFEDDQRFKAFLKRKKEESLNQV